MVGCDIIFEKTMTKIGTHTLDRFEFKNGRVLENVDVEYITHGTPKYDDEGYIINSVIFFTSFRDQFSFLRNSHEYIKENSDLSDEFFFIIIRSLGFPNSCSPSTTGLKHEFPNYTYRDIVNFKRQFLAEKFNIKNILGLIGEGFKSYEILTWACEYPDEMEFLFILNTSYKTSGYSYVLAKCIENIIETTDDFYSDVHSTSFTKIIIAINTLLFAHSSSKKILHKIDNMEMDSLMEDFIEEGLFTDIYDFKYYVDCILSYDVEDKLSNIKAKTLIVGNNDTIFDFELDMMPLKEYIADCIVLIHKFEPDNYHFSEEHYEPLGKEVIRFLEQFKK